MKTPKHPDDAALLLHASGEQPSAHIDACEHCLARQAQLLSGVRSAENAWRGEIRKQQPFGLRYPAIWAAAGLAVMVFAAGLAWQGRVVSYGDSPDPRLTPGRANPRANVCLGSDEQRVGLSDSRAMEVFRRYAIAKPRPGDFELDYLIPADLGGSGHPDNLWPQPYRAGVWNSHVKDALEERLHALVCAGQLDLATAQKDLASGWIEAYKRYFQTDVPLQDHAGFLKDRPWE